MIDISMEIRVECEKFGEVTKVTLWDEEPEGVVTVRFKDPEDAIACMEVGSQSIDQVQRSSH